VYKYTVIQQIVPLCENGVYAWRTLKQRAVMELLVVEKELEGNIHKPFCAVYGSCAVDTTPLDAGFRELRLQKWRNVAA